MRIKALDAPNEIIKKGWQQISVNTGLQLGYFRDEWDAGAIRPAFKRSSTFCSLAVSLPQDSLGVPTGIVSAFLGLSLILDTISYNPGRFYAHIGQAERLWSFNRDSFEVTI